MVVPRSVIAWFISTAPEECIQALEEWQHNGWITILGDPRNGTAVDPLVELHAFIEDPRHPPIKRSKQPAKPINSDREITT
ncbi:MAG: hypothetical protein ACR2OZ_05230 [Verrucomicrobiales bacterium]